MKQSNLKGMETIILFQFCCVVLKIDPFFLLHIFVKVDDLIKYFIMMGVSKSNNFCSNLAFEYCNCGSAKSIRLFSLELHLKEKETCFVVRAG